MSRIDPSAIPGTALDPDAVLAAADELARGGVEVRDIGADVVAQWRQLSGHYEAPEAPRLFTAMNPVESKSREFGDDVEKVASALRAYAEEIRPIKTALAGVRGRAWGFVGRTNSDPEWQYKQELVDENTALVREVNGLQVQLWEAERRCANAIRALYGAAAWRAATSADDPLGYGISEIPTDADAPWGSEVPRKDHCPKSAGVSVKRFVWDGIVVDGLWGTVTGLGMLVGIDGSGWSWDTMKTSWVGMGSLIGYAGGEWSWGNAGNAWLELGKGLIAYDTWGDDPARAAGGAVFNIATILVPAGAAVSGTKGAATAAGNGARVSSWLQAGARVVDFTDPVALTVRGARAAMPHLDDLATGLVNLGRGIEIPDLSSALDDVAGTGGVDDVVRSVDGTSDVPPVRDPQTTTSPVRGDGPAGTGSAADPSGSPAPVREPVPVGAGAAADAPAPVRGPEAPTTSTPGHAVADAGAVPDATPGSGTAAPGGSSPSAFLGDGSAATSGPGGAAPSGPGGVGHGADGLVRPPGQQAPDVVPGGGEPGTPSSSGSEGPSVGDTGRAVDAVESGAGHAATDAGRHPDSVGGSPAAGGADAGPTVGPDEPPALPPAEPTGEASLPPDARNAEKAAHHGVQNPVEGMRVWRVFGEAQDGLGGLERGSRPFGESWTPVDPRRSSDFRWDAGLPDENPGRFVVEGNLRRPSHVVDVRPALPLHGNPGGWPEYLIRDAGAAVEIRGVSGLNEDWTRSPGEWQPPGP
nr:hypothetical protein [uncultured Actinotalea sp.]